VRDVEDLLAVLQEADDRRLSNTTKGAKQREVEASLWALAGCLNNAIDGPAGCSH
jgi:hypothetical protein